MSKELIRLVDCQMAFDGEVVLDDINIYFNDKEFLTLLGPSGCGKTTTLRIIGGFLAPTKGDVLFDGVRINDVPPYKRKVNTVFQKYALFPHLDVYDNIAFGLRIAKVPEDEIDERVCRMLEVVSLKGFENRKISSLSGGQQQRVAIARALANDPNVLLCDEATSALDPQTTRSILRLLKQLNETLGITIVLITHEMAVVKEICHRVAVMEHGRVVEQGDVFHVFADPKQEITKSFIHTTSNLQKIEELVAENSPVVQLQPGEVVVRLSYLQKNVSGLLISAVSQKLGISLNIIFADITIVQDAPIGGTVTIIHGARKQITEAME